VTPKVVKIGQARLLRANIVASNGVLHVVDEVNLPPDVQPMPTTGEGQNQ
jgi:uncharacterized surface protein with fasciclin (FAS1) repeats